MLFYFDPLFLFLSFWGWEGWRILYFAVYLLLIMCINLSLLGVIIFYFIFIFSVIEVRKMSKMQQNSFHFRSWFMETVPSAPYNLCLVESL